MNQSNLYKVSAFNGPLAFLYFLKTIISASLFQIANIVASVFNVQTSLISPKNIRLLTLNL